MTITYYYVTAFDNARTGWYRYGSSPYLSTINYPTDYIAIADGVTDIIGDFDFANSGAENSEVIDSVAVEIYRKDKLNDTCEIIGYVWNGAAWVSIGAFLVSNGVWAWKSIDVSAILNTWAKIDSARLYLVGVAADTNLAYVDCARLKVVSHAVAGAVLKRLLVGVGL